jgi:hypothetical protein
MSNVIRQMKLTTRGDATDIIEIVKVVVDGKVTFHVLCDGELVHAPYTDAKLADDRFVRECRDYFHEMM